MSRLIDLDKLIQECSAMKGDCCSGNNCKHDTCDTTSVSQCIKKVAESIVEPEIDFDALYNEWCKNTKDWSELRSPYDQARSLRDFLKSKNLTVQKPFEIPVKKTWTLKKEYQEAFKNFDFSFNSVLSFESEPAARRIKYYDLNEEPDYSKIPKGSIVEIECLGDKFYTTFVKFEHGNVFTKEVGEIEQWSPNVIIRVVELAKE